MKKRILSIFMAVLMVVSLLPVSVFAADTDNLCDHHTEHTADCGYAAAVAGSDCTHSTTTPAAISRLWKVCPAPAWRQRTAP